MDIILHPQDMQKLAYSSMDRLEHYVADKMSKITKPVILCRWMTFTQITYKHVSILCAHWYNNGTLPKFAKSWPGLDILQTTNNLMFSNYLQKWCYPKKDDFEIKPKSLITKSTTEVVKGCEWAHTCDICDIYFSKWKRLDDVVAKCLAPDTTGMYIISLCFGKIRKIVDIGFGSEVLSIKECVEYYYKRTNYVFRINEFVDENSFFEVRWMVFADPTNDNCCLLYAHWLNSDKPSTSYPYFTCILPGKRILEKNEHFLYRTEDKKWCYKIDHFKHLKVTKFRYKKHMLNEADGF
ncbi:uncharacterized protein CDAR_237001 [Caerostris darwini]|uniref:Uncharacterized protein n=1 Tax=Caerostris darwini TaxID=1538125 RepID=A0AAV4W216_9ARAC|nr:uncharacterized protein CDAR_237001 [Caerostris darwini]